MNVRKAWLQREIGHYVFFIPFCGSLIYFMRTGLRYRIRDLKRLRAEYKALTRDRRPLLICCNHLTYMDPVLLIYAFGNHWWYFFNYRCLSWNIPALEYKGNPFFRLVCFAAKCIFIDRGGSRDHHTRILTVARDLMAKSEVLTVFPEGRRSRTGRFDSSKLAYGLGRIVSELPECRVLCVYLRADEQEAKTSFPKRGSNFTLMHELIEFRGEAARESLHAFSQASNRERVTAITREVAARIQRLESRYFAEHPEFAGAGKPISALPDSSARDTEPATV